MFNRKGDEFIAAFDHVGQGVDVGYVVPVIQHVVLFGSLDIKPLRVRNSDMQADGDHETWLVSQSYEPAHDIAAAPVGRWDIVE